jgi:hypothetical protein
MNSMLTKLVNGKPLKATYNNLLVLVISNVSFTQLATLYMLLHFIFLRTLCDRHSYYLYFTDEEIGVQLVSRWAIFQSKIFLTSGPSLLTTLIHTLSHISPLVLIYAVNIPPFVCKPFLLSDMLPSIHSVMWLSLFQNIWGSQNILNSVKTNKGDPAPICPFLSILSWFEFNKTCVLLGELWLYMKR